MAEWRDRTQQGEGACNKVMSAMCFVALFAGAGNECHLAGIAKNGAVNRPVGR